MAPTRQAGVISMELQAELRTPVAAAQLAHFHIAGPSDHRVFDSAHYRFDLGLTPRPRTTRACYPDHWRPHHFAPVGNTFLLPPDTAMRARNDGDLPGMTSIICLLDRHALVNLLGADIRHSPALLSASLDITSPAIRQLLHRLGQELQQPGLGSNALLDLVALQLGVELARLCQRLETRQQGRGLAPWQLRRIDERLREVCASPSLAELAELCDISVRHLARGFAVSRGYSIGQHVQHCRAELAKELLQGGESIPAVAARLGFTSVGNFSQAFRRVVGVAPTGYRAGLYGYDHQKL